jgi:hypothetical protein
VQIIIAIGEYMQRNYMAATHSWWSSSPNSMSTLVPIQVVDERLQQLGYLKKLKDVVKEDPTLTAKKLQRRLEKHYNIELSYFKVWSGKKSAMDDLRGTWEDTFDMLWRFKAALEECCPGSIVEIDCKKINGEMYFSRMFVAIRACIDGFLAGCRPYLGVDSTHLTWKYKGQLAAATAVDGHNWMYPVAYGIFGKETNFNWTWFMAQLKRAVGTPPGLTIHTDVCKGLA